MNKLNPIKAFAALFLILVCFGAAWASDTRHRLVDRSVLRVRSSTADIDTSAADYTGYIALVTVAPLDGVAMLDCKFVVDLDKVTTGWADVGTTETITFAVQRKVDGTNWRTDEQSDTSALAADDSDDVCVSIDVGAVGPNEDLRLVVKNSAEAGDVELPYVFYYRSFNDATFTDASN